MRLTEYINIFTAELTAIKLALLWISENSDREVAAETYHYTATRLVRECFKRNEASQWKRPKFDPSPHQNPLTELHKN